MNRSLDVAAEGLRDFVEWMEDFDGTKLTINVELEFDISINGAPVSGATPAAAFYIAVVKQLFPQITSFGVVSVRNIAGTSTPSQHSWGNAVDAMCAGETLRDLAYFVDANRGLLNIAHLLADPYFPSPLGDHFNHVHADFNPQYPI